MSGVALLRPEWLLALLPLAAFWLWHRARPASLGGWNQVMRPEILRAMAALGHVSQTGRPWRLRAVMLASVLVILGLAGPAVERREALSFRNLDAVIFVLDVSAEMAERSDWTEVQLLGRFAIAALGTRPGALIVYGGDAYIATDLTRDHTQLGQTFALIEPGLVPDPGAEPARALALAERILTEGQILGGDVVLITSGTGAGLRAEAQSIAATGARLSVVALGGHAPPWVAELGGRVFGARDIDPLSLYLQAQARTALERDDYPLLYWRDFGRYVLALAVLPLLLLFRREGPRL